MKTCLSFPPLMTAEIVIMNGNAVSMAADSVVTLSNGKERKTYSTVNKLFALSYEHSIGIMVYGNANLMNVPWETVIKLYRKQIINQPFKTVEDCSKNFIHFLEKNNFSTIEDQESVALSRYYFFHQSIKDAISDRAKNKRNGSIQTNNILSDVFEMTTTFLNKCPNANKLKVLSDFRKKKEKDFEAILLKVYENVYENIKDDLTRINNLYFKKIINMNTSGVVIAGFGEEEIFPTTCSLTIDQMFMGRVRYSSEITSCCGGDAAIIPFAQSEMVHSFMEGVEPGCMGIIKQHIHSELNDIKKTQKTIDQIKESLKIEYTNPIMSTLKGLPKSELALMAETLVNLTSFKRKISNQLETVGGPIDVAVISKGDGFVWVKRKHYFQPELNPHFIAKHYKGTLK